ncbi:NAD-binding site [Bryobacterales bacterium F-183]|nr:NAD-binding site [Bryobacterales bacterium F-183]
MKTVAVLGGGPAGSVAAARLAQGGVKAILIDEKLAWEKPCGGGVTCKAYKEYPFLIENDTPKKLVRNSCLSEPSAGSATLEMSQPLLIYARKDLNGMLLERAAKQGADIVKSRVTAAERASDGGWNITTKQGNIHADSCIVALGARNPLRNMGAEWRDGDTMTALGYFVDSDRDHVDIRFLQGFEGYIWVFPRLGHLSVGICGKGESAQAMRARLERYMDEEGIPYKDARFYGHMLPSLEQSSWRSHRVAGDGWLAVGDSAGLVDPVTGEGIYYAVRSGDVAATSLLEHGTIESEAAYRDQLKREFIDDLTYGAHLSKRLFCESIFGASMTSRMIQLMRRSPLLTQVVEDLFAGSQNYLTLKKRLLETASGLFPDMMLRTFFPSKV